VCSAAGEAEQDEEAHEIHAFECGEEVTVKVTYDVSVSLHRRGEGSMTRLRFVLPRRHSVFGRRRG
jgi:hypothetical protein